MYVLYEFAWDRCVYKTVVLEYLSQELDDIITFVVVMDPGKPRMKVLHGDCMNLMT